MATDQEIINQINQLDNQLNILNQKQDRIKAEMQDRPILMRAPYEDALRAVRSKIIEVEGQRANLAATLSEQQAAVAQAEGDRLWLEQMAAKYPKADPAIGGQGYYHIDYMYSNPLQFFADVHGAYENILSQSGQAEATNYVTWIRNLTMSVLEPGHYKYILDPLHVDLLNWVVWYIYPEQQTYNLSRWIYGPDARPEELYALWNTEAQKHITANDQEGYLKLKNWVLENLKILQESDPAYAEPLKQVSTKTQAEFIKNFVPELIDEIDKANIEMATTGKDAKTIMLLALIGIGGTALIFGLGGRKRKAAQTAAPQIIKV